MALGKLLQKEEGEPKTDVEAQHIKTMMNSEHKQLQAASVEVHKFVLVRTRAGITLSDWSWHFPSFINTLELLPGI